MPGKGVCDSSIFDIIDLFYLLSNLLRPDMYAGFIKRIDSLSYNLRYSKGKVLFPDGPY